MPLKIAKIRVLGNIVCYVNAINCIFLLSVSIIAKSLVNTKVYFPKNGLVIENIYTSSHLLLTPAFIYDIVKGV